jgi:hypothetical protein
MNVIAFARLYYVNTESNKIAWSRNPKPAEQLVASCDANQRIQSQP